MAHGLRGRWHLWGQWQRSGCSCLSPLLMHIYVMSQRDAHPGWYIGLRGRCPGGIGLCGGAWLINHHFSVGRGCNDPGSRRHSCTSMPPSETSIPLLQFLALKALAVCMLFDHNGHLRCSADTPASLCMRAARVQDSRTDRYRHLSRQRVLGVSARGYPHHPQKFSGAPIASVLTAHRAGKS